MAPNPKRHLCPIRGRTQREQDVKTQALEEGGYVKAEPEIGVMLQTGDTLGHQTLEDTRKDSLPENWKEHGPANT